MDFFTSLCTEQVPSAQCPLALTVNKIDMCGGAYTCPCRVRKHKEPLRLKVFGTNLCVGKRQNLA